VISDIQYTHLLTVWGQYIDHDLGITPQKILDYFNFF